MVAFELVLHQPPANAFLAWGPRALPVGAADAERPKTTLGGNAA